MNFGLRLKNLRKRNCLTQDDIAKELGVSQQMVSYYESGKSKPDAEFLTKVAAYFGVSIDFLTARVSDDKVLDEQVVIESFRNIPPSKKPLALQMMKLLETSEDDNE